MASNTILVKGYGPQEEALANAAITPGNLIELMSTGKVRKHSTAGGNVGPKQFAIEDELQGNPITTDYDADDLVQFVVPQSGDWIYALLKDGEDVAIGDLLESDGAGDLQVYTQDDSNVPVVSNNVVAEAREAVDLSGGSSADPSTRRILVQIV